MVRYLFYTIGDLTYQSPLVVAPKDFCSKISPTCRNFCIFFSSFIFLSFCYCGLRPMLDSEFRELASSYVRSLSVLRRTQQIFIFDVKTVTIFYIETLEELIPAKQLNLESQTSHFSFRMLTPESDSFCCF